MQRCDRHRPTLLRILHDYHLLLLCVLLLSPWLPTTNTAQTAAAFACPANFSYDVAIISALPGRPHPLRTLATLFTSALTNNVTPTVFWDPTCV